MILRKIEMKLTSTLMIDICLTNSSTRKKVTVSSILRKEGMRIKIRTWAWMMARTNTPFTQPKNKAFAKKKKPKTK